MAAASGNPRGRFAAWTTAGYAVLWLAVVADGWGPLLERDPLVWLQFPEVTAERMTERDLELAEAVARDTGALRPLLDRLYGSPDEARDYAIEIQRELLAAGSEETVRLRLAILLLDRATPDDLTEARSLLGDRETLDTAELPGLGISPAYTERAARAIARLRGDQAGVEAAQVELGQRGDQWKRRSLGLLFTNLAIVAVGFALLAVRGGRVHGAPGAAPPFGLADGLGVFIRGDFWNRLVLLLLSGLASTSPGAWLAATPAGSLLWTWGSLFASLPLVWLIHRHLLAPAGLGFVRVFGLDGGPRGWATVTGVALCATAIDLAGTHALGWLAWGAGVGSSWVEGIDESLIWGGSAEAFLTAVDYTVWTPAFEELAFRGVLYFALRRRLAALPAAVSSATFFAVVHFYSLPGLAMTLWSGLVWALAFERSRSVLPGIAAHAVYNGLFVAGLVLLYR